MPVQQTDNAALAEIASATLKLYRNAARAAPFLATKVRKNRRLLVAMALFYLEHGDRARDDNPRQNVPVAAAEADQLVRDTHSLSVPTSAAAPSQASNGRTIHVAKHDRKMKPFWRHPPRSEAQKEAARTAMLVGSSLWRSFGMEKLRYRELDAFIRDHAKTGSQFVKQGTTNIQRAALAWLIKQHAVPSDESQLVSELVNENDLSKLAAQAVSHAPKIAETLAQRDADAILENVKLIAAE